MFLGGCEVFDVDRLCVSDPVRLQLVTAQLVREDINLQIQAVENSDLEDTAKVQKKSKLQARLSCWSPRGRGSSALLRMIMMELLLLPQMLPSGCLLTTGPLFSTLEVGTPLRWRGSGSMFSPFLTLLSQ